nr:tetrahydrofolate dehydrogenase/cyclohydrolase catalytic domain-containing protein [Halomarina salina]
MTGDRAAERILSTVRSDVETLRAHGVVPTLGTVLMSDDETQTRFMELKHERCAELGIETRRRDVPADAPASTLYDTVRSLGADDDVTALFVQVPLPDHVDGHRVHSLVPIQKDVDCFAPENLGRLVTGEPRVVPVTVRAVVELLSAYGIETAGRHVVVVGRDPTIARPLANLLLKRGPGGDATVSVCHTATTDLASVTRRADVLVTAAGAPGLVDGSMLGDGVVVVDVSATRVDVTESAASGSESNGPGTRSESGAERRFELVGDVDFDSAATRASAITPVPGGVGPLTQAMLVRNVVDVTARRTGASALLTSP